MNSESRARAIAFSERAIAIAAGTPSSTEISVAAEATFRLLSAANCSCQASPRASYQRSE